MGTDDAPAKRPFTSRQRILIRLIVAPLILAVVVGLLLLHHQTGSPLSSFALVTLMGAVGGHELAALFRRADPGVSVLHATVVCGALCGVGLLAPDEADAYMRADLRLGFLTAGLLALLFRHLTDVRREALTHLSLGMLPMLYVGLLFSAMVEVASGSDGAMRALYVVLVAKCSDMGGWLVGKPFGKHKLVPTVSPGKSWEGAGGGIAMSVAAALFLPAWLGLDPEAAWSAGARIGFGVLLAVASILAGVTQSGFKRRVGAKDSSTLIPEMGGVLDMIDSLLFAGPAAYLWYRMTLG